MELRGSTTKREVKPIHFTESLDEHPSVREEPAVELQVKEDKKKNGTVAEN